MPTTIINISNRLPVTVKPDGITRSSGGLVAALEGLPADRYDLRWLGWTGGEIDDPQRRRDVEQTLQIQFGCTPVFLSREEADGHYEGFSNSTLWPLLHYMPLNMRYEGGWWDHYRTVNQRFADAALAVARAGDLVWVHDYQLMLLPALLKTAMPSLRVGFFLHTPFPAYEVFRCHPRRAELVEGILGADVVGFHTFGYLRHFRETAFRILGAATEFTEVRHNGHITRLGIYPIGINARKFEEELATPAFAAERDRLELAHQGKQVVLSVERLDYTKGIVRRLRAIDIFLERRSAEDRERVKFIFVSIPSREGVEEYRDLRVDVTTRIGRLNGKYATLHHSPIHFIHGSVGFTELCALYAAADVALVTPLVDGMNLVAKEYVVCRRDKPGILVLSEFAGAAEELFNAVAVNPYDPPALATAIADALDMPPAEREARMTPMRQRVLTHDVQGWTRAFVQDLAAPQDAADKTSRVEQVRDRILQALQAGRRVALFFDYDGTVRELERVPSAASPHRELKDLLQRLRNRPNLDVTIISGRIPRELESWLGEFGFGLIAEHGAAFRRPHAAEWERLDRDESYTWKESALKVLRLYEDSTPGSHVEEKRTSLVWHYRRVEPEFGDWRAKQLAHELVGLMANQPVTVRHGKKIVEITSIHVNKGAAVRRIVEQQTYDVVLCAGDDTTDENMFRLDLNNLVSIKIGSGDTAAQLTLPSPAAFRQFLRHILDSPS